MKGWVLVLAFTLAIVTALSVGLYVSVAHAFKFLKNSSMSAFSYSFQDSEITQSSYQLSPTGSISVGNLNGKIVVTTHEEPQVVVKITKEGDKRDFNFVTTKLENGRDILSLETVYKKNNCHASVSYELVIPKKSSLKAKTLNGAITITGVVGDIEAQSSNGSLTFKETPSLLHAQTVNGGIKIVTEILTPQEQSVHIQTVNGSIYMEAHTIGSGTFSVKTVNGSITLALPELPDQQSGKHTASFTIPCADGKSASFDIQTVNGFLSLSKIS